MTGPIAPTSMVDDCWNRIGVDGDSSCPELVAHVHCRNCPVFTRAARTFFDRPAPAGYLDEWSARLAAPPAPARADDLSTLVFRLGDEWLALPLAVVAEVLVPRPIHRVPHRTNRVFLGLTNLRGQLHLCASLHGLLEVAGVDGAADSPELPRLVLACRQGDAWAFPVDEVVGVRRVARDRLQKVPSTLADPVGSYCRAIFDLGDGRVVNLLDEPRVFAGFRRMGG